MSDRWDFAEMVLMFRTKHLFFLTHYDRNFCGRRCSPALFPPHAYHTEHFLRGIQLADLAALGAFSAAVPPAHVHNAVLVLSNNNQVSLVG